MALMVDAGEHGGHRVEVLEAAERAAEVPVSVCSVHEVNQR